MPDLITAFSVATGIYLDYWTRLASDADARLFPGEDLQLIVFTDQVARAFSHASQLQRARVTVIEVEPMGWPAATMRRYELITSAQAEVKGSLLIHLDADMRITEPAGEGLDPDSWAGGIACVKHPGYYRGDSFLGRLVSRPRLALGDLKAMMWAGEIGLGEWERRPESSAYVAPRLRKSYACGGVWMGRSQRLLDMCQLLSERMAFDTSRGIIARWHDESYLNWFVAHQNVTLLSPSYCYASGLTELAQLPNIITATDKGEQRVRT